MRLTRPLLVPTAMDRVRNKDGGRKEGRKGSKRNNATNSTS